MVKTKLRDIEISVQAGILKVTPYKLQVSADNYLSGDISERGRGKVFEMSMRSPDKDLIDFILGTDHTMRGDWEDYLTHDTTERLAINPPERIQKWLDKLPEYELTLRRD